jgi:hypothetical protein
MQNDYFIALDTILRLKICNFLNPFSTKLEIIKKMMGGCEDALLIVYVVK